jgi:hypothetical protein
VDVTASDAPIRDFRDYTIRSRNSGKDAFRLTRKACEAADTCARCGGSIGPTETVYIGWAWQGYLCHRLSGFREWHAPMCRDCVPGLQSVKVPSFRSAAGGWVVAAESCPGCGRNVVVEESAARYRRRQHLICSQRCQYTYHNKQRSERTQKAREKTCEVCGEGFTAKRSDTKTCSSRCRQKAYRKRLKVAD